MFFKIGTLPEWTVIETQSGRMGIKGPGAGKKCVVVFADGTEKEVPPEFSVQVVKFPAELATEYLGNEELKRKKGLQCP